MATRVWWQSMKNSGEIYWLYGVYNKEYYIYFLFVNCLRYISKLCYVPLPPCSLPQESWLLNLRQHPAGQPPAVGLTQVQVLY